jgi:peptidoglycan/LPS O-acetylase OafA/YrhL
MHKINNFDLIRLFAASQVALTHIATHLGYTNFFFQVIAIFPGVPIFFFISGFLIYGSYEKSQKNRKVYFFINRGLRIYPALCFCLIFSTIIIWVSGYFETRELNIIDLLKYFVAQVSFFQFYNIDFFKDWGVGAVNGALWTISVELQFYIITPIIYYFLNHFKKMNIFTLLFIFLIFNTLNSNFNDKDNIVLKLINVSFIPWLYMFLLGAIFYKFKNLQIFTKNLSFGLLLTIFLISYFVTKDFGWGNKINPASFFILGLIIFKLAFANPSLSNSILNNNDISYGIYIFHMPIVNYLIYKNIGNPENFLLAIIFTLTLSVISWFFIEKFFLKFKKYTLRK